MLDFVAKTVPFLELGLAELERRRFCWDLRLPHKTRVEDFAVGL